MIELKNEVFINEEFIKAVRTINSSDEMSAKAAYWFNRFSKELQERSKDFDEIKQKLLEKYGKLNEEKGHYDIEKDNVNEFTKQFEELLTQQFEINLTKILFPETIKISPYQIELLEDIFDFSTLEG